MDALAKRQGEVGLGAPLELVERARDYAAAAVAPRTREAYRAAWARFADWCDAHGCQALPASGATVALYIAAQADAGRAVAGLEVDLAALSFAHRAAGHPSPRASAEVRAVRAGVRRTKGTAQRQAAPLLAGELRQALQALPEGLLGVRDRALLLLGWAGAFRRSELVSLAVADVRFVPEGLEVTLRRSKTDQDGAGRVVAVAPGSSAATCPVRAVRAWLEAARLAEGPLFRSVNRHGQVGALALSGRAVALVVKRSGVAAGLDGAGLSGHSLRRGFVTSAVRSGKSYAAVKRQTGHRSDRVLQRYVQAAGLWQEENASSGVGL